MTRRKELDQQSKDELVDYIVALEQCLADLEAKVGQPRKTVRKSAGLTYAAVADWSYVARELGRRGVTLKLLWRKRCRRRRSSCRRRTTRAVPGV